MWDDDGGPAISSQNNSRSYVESGFSIGRGRGYGGTSTARNAQSHLGNDKSSFNDRAPVNDDSGWQGDDRWNEDSKTTENNWQNNNASNNWQSNSNDNRSSNKACFICKQTGHISKNCPSGSRSYDRNGYSTNDRTVYSRKGSGCFTCGQDGHMSRDCPSGGGDRKRGCFKCGEEGHMSRECPSGGGGGRGGDRGRACFKCGEEGHMSRDCPSGGGSDRGRACFKCGEEGHMSRDCPSGGGSDRGRACFKCGEEGHMSRDCPSGGGGGNDRGRACFKCGEEGHMSRDCPSGGGGERSRACFKCGEEGHMSRECPSGGGGERGRSGFKYGEEGHMSRQYLSGGGGGGSDRKSSCYNCGGEGHMSRDCPNADGKKKSGCFKCGEDGHMAKDCTNPDTRTGPDGKPRAPIYIPPDISEDASDIFETNPTGINFSKYDSIPVDVSGSNVPPLISDFRSANLSQLLCKNIERAGYTKPTPVQKHAIPIIMGKRDLMACAETGSGKTAAFLLPILHSLITDPNLPNNANKDIQEPLALILSPTRELAMQIRSETVKFAYDSVVKVEVIYGGTSTSHQSSKIKRGIHILVATPGRLDDFVEKNKISFAKLRYLVLDEADRMLDMGFLPKIEKIVEDPSTPPKGVRQTLMFSATFAEDIQRLAAKFLEDYLFLTIGTVGGANSDVTQTFFQLGQHDKREKLLEILKESKTDRVLVFVEQKRTADFLATFTSQHEIPTTSIHGDRLQREREEALQDFRKGKMPCLVATAVAARGLDIKDVRHVINYDLPQSIDEYVHRIGRTGRVGNLGRATSFYDPNSDQPIARSLKKILMDANQEVPDWLNEAAAHAIGTTQNYSRSNFGGRDVRSQNRTRPDATAAWENFPPTNNNNYSQPAETNETWD